MNRQQTLSNLCDELAKARTRKKDFLKQIDRIVPWGEWVKKIKPYYYKGERGNKPYDIELMLRIYVLQNLYDLSDMGVKVEVIDSRSFSDFCGVDMPQQVPDGDTIGRFRNILSAHKLQEELFLQVAELLRSRGLILKKGTIVDSTIISAPTSTKNKEKKRDPDAHSVKKGNNWYFGYKAHIGVDSETGLAHSVKTTAANVHDVTVTEELLTREEEVVYGDAGYIGAEERENAVTENKSGKRIRYEINRRRSSIKKLPETERSKAKEAEHGKSSVRAKVEHIFGVVKRLFHCRKTRYRGLAKQEQKMNMIFALANLYLADKRYALA